MLQRTYPFRQMVEGSASARLGILVQVTIAGKPYRFVRASRPLPVDGATTLTENLVEDVGAVGSTLNPLTRAVSIGEVSVTFQNDAFLRALFSANRMFGQQVQMWWGPEELAATATDNWLPLWTGVVSEIEVEEGKIALRCHDLFTLLTGDISSYSAVNKHPLQVIRDILSLAGIPDALVNEKTFQPQYYSQGTYPTSHWNTTRAIHEGIDRRIVAPVSAGSLFLELSAILNGTLLIDETGMVSFVAYDPLNSPVDNWDASDVRDVKPKTTLSNIINHAVCRFDWDGTSNASTILTNPTRTSLTPVLGRSRNVSRDSDGSNSGYRCSVVRDDVPSQVAYAYPGQSGRVVSEHLETKWLGVRSYLIASSAGLNSNGQIDLGDAGAIFGIPGATTPGGRVGDWFMLAGGWVSSFCGIQRFQNQADGSGISDNQSNYNLLPGTGRVGYILVDKEIILVDHAYAGQDRYVPGSYNGSSSQSSAGNKGSESPVPNSPANAVFQIRKRGALGTTAATHDGGGRTAGTTYGSSSQNASPNLATDVTIPVTLVRTWLDRFSDGCPTVAVTTGLHKAHLQLGDLVTFPSDVFLAYGLNGVTSASAWEVTAKSVLLTDGNPRVEWELSLARIPPTYGADDQASAATTTTIASSVVTIDVNGLTAAASGAGSDVATINSSKLGTITASGLQATVPAGTISRPNILTPTAAATVNLTPSKDNYLSYDAHSYGYILKTVATGATPPDVGGTASVLHAKAAATATGATMTDLRKSSPMTSAIISPAQFNAAMVINRSLNKNPSFAVVSDPSQPPDGWSTDTTFSSPAATWGSIDAISKNTASFSSSQPFQFFLGTAAQSYSPVSKYALVLAGTAAPTSGNYAVISDAFSVNSGYWYQVELRGKLDNALSTAPAIDVVWLDGSKTVLSTTTLSLTTFTISTLVLKGQAQAPTNAVFAQIRIYRTGYTDSVEIFYCGATELPVAFRYHQSLTQSMTTNVFTAVAFPIKDYDWTNSAVQANPTVFTAPEDGLYIFEARVTVGVTVAAAKQFVTSIYVNGAEAARGSDASSGAAGWNIGAMVAADLYLTAGQTVNVLFFDNDTGTGLQTVAGTATCYFQGRRVSP